MYKMIMSGACVVAFISFAIYPAPKWVTLTWIALTCLNVNITRRKL